jgi:hypothetical protein
LIQSMFLTKVKRMNSKVVDIVKERAGDYCETCGKAAQPSMALHHRQLRSRGGKDVASNIIRIHHGCHNLKTNSIHLNPSISEAKGWICPSWKDPTEHPFVRPDGSIVLLNNDGGFTVLEEGK